MTEREARQALFDLRLEYMKHTPDERDLLYEEYIKKFEIIKKELAKRIKERKEKEVKTR